MNSFEPTIHVDNNLSFEYYTRLAFKMHEAALNFILRGEREKGVVLLTRFVSFVLETLPAHKNYHSGQNNHHSNNSHGAGGSGSGGNNTTPAYFHPLAEKKKLLSLCKHAIDFLEKEKRNSKEKEKEKKAVATVLSSRSASESESDSNSNSRSHLNSGISSSSSGDKQLAAKKHNLEKVDDSKLKNLIKKGEPSSFDETDNGKELTRKDGGSSDVNVQLGTEKTHSKESAEINKNDPEILHQQHQLLQQRPQLHQQQNEKLFQKLVLKHESDFEEIQPLGSGTFGKVVLVRLKDNNNNINTNTSEGSNDEDQIFVIKRIMYDSISDIAAISQEAHLLRQLSNHSNIVKYYSIFVSTIIPNTMCLLMEYCNGGDFANWQAKNTVWPIPEVILLVWMEQLASALRTIHSLNILHRDLKPSNFFLQFPLATTSSSSLLSSSLSSLSLSSTTTTSAATTTTTTAFLSSHQNSIASLSASDISAEEFWSLLCPSTLDLTVYPPIIKLGDFGLGYQLASGKTKASTRAGTVAYWSPEVMTSEPSSKASEVYSFGAIFFEACLGPQTPATSLFLLNQRQVLIDRFTTLYSEPFCDCIRNMICEEPENRSTFQEIHSELELIKEIQFESWKQEALLKIK